MAITLNSGPLNNRFLLDANNTLVSITSTNGSGYYFRANIFVDDLLFDTQGWSRVDGFTAIKDLKKLYSSYYETIFNAVFANGLIENLHLVKKISISIEEKLLTDNTVSGTLILPPFYLCYNQKPTEFNDQVKGFFTGLDAVVLQVSKNGKISIPFFCNTNNETIVCQLIDNFGTILNTQSIASVSGKRFFQYNFNLQPVILANNAVFLNVTITIGTFVLQKNIRLLTSPNFEVKEICYQNNFGFYNYAYLDGAMQIENSLTTNSYTQNDGSEKVSEIDEEQTYSINTGSLLESEKTAIREITNSLDTKLFYNNKWYDLNAKTKKTTLFKDRNNSYSEGLVFTAKENTTLLNSGLGLDVPVVSPIYIDVILAQENTPNVAEIFVSNDSAAAETGYTLVAFKNLNNLLFTDITATIFDANSGTVVLYTLPEPGLWSFYIKKGTFESAVFNQLFTF
jgi:hypothetical protein